MRGETFILGKVLLPMHFNCLMVLLAGGKQLELMDNNERRKVLTQHH